MGTFKKTWVGGYVIESANGRPLYIIQRRVNGKRINRSTGCTQERAAIEQLGIFERDPLKYRPVTKVQVDAVENGPVRITAKLVEQYADGALETAKKAGKTTDWVMRKVRLIRHWMVDLNGADLRAMNPAQLRKIAEGKTSTMHRIEAIKVFCHWLRNEGKLNRENDPTMELNVPQPKNDRAMRERDVDPALVHMLYKYLPLAQTTESEIEDAKIGQQILVLQAGTGWHVSEVLRFATTGKLKQDKEGNTVAEVKHKKGVLHHTVLRFPEHGAAAEYLLSVKVPSHNKLCALVRNVRTKVAKDEAKFWTANPQFATFGFGDMRHTVGTFAAENGADDEAAAKFLGHSVEMYRQKYKGRKVVNPPKPIPVIRMEEALLH